MQNASGLRVFDGVPSLSTDKPAPDCADLADKERVPDVYGVAQPMSSLSVQGPGNSVWRSGDQNLSSRQCRNRSEGSIRHDDAHSTRPGN